MLSTHWRLGNSEVSESHPKLDKCEQLAGLSPTQPTPPSLTVRPSGVVFVDCGEQVGSGPGGVGAFLRRKGTPTRDTPRILFLFFLLRVRQEGPLYTRLGQESRLPKIACQPSARRTAGAAGFPSKKGNPVFFPFLEAVSGRCFWARLKQKRSLFSAAEPVYIEAALECRTCCLLRPSWGPAGSSSGGPQRTLRAVPPSPAL